ncbi:DUF732 domain-containing protein [Corynebacterium sp. TAE3-ERU12]|uniref:DUF732 domain-containing protein n=1 Tax=Corynebacterium sp. TAE3-ERU12 TaxID=2849491 RepID=UPI001C46BE9F|nr:DUF732 domain-containing protein [Corynebacterium sp. TAE3-ERU12]MBV7296066.1 DUF732 domain-containing protein [Corynebacterium sp. TAE3-ERU12]
MRRSALSQRRAAVVAAMVVTGLSVSACGGATVEDSEVTDTEIVTTTSTTTKKKDDKDKKTEADSTRPSKTKAGDPPIPDPGPTRIDEAPDNRMPLTEADEDYLLAITDFGVDISGTEDQLIAAGHAHCNGTESDKAIVDAAAGQLVAQGRTEKKPEEVSAVIAKSADKAYC